MSPSLIHDWLIKGPMVCNPGAGTLSCHGIMISMAVSCPKGGILQPFHLSSAFNSLYVLNSETFDNYIELKKLYDGPFSSAAIRLRNTYGISEATSGCICGRCWLRHLDHEGSQWITLWWLHHMKTWLRSEVKGWSLTEGSRMLCAFLVFYPPQPSFCLSFLASTGFGVRCPSSPPSPFHDRLNPLKCEQNKSFLFNKSIYF